MNVLILSVAAKVLLVQAFQAAVAPRGGRVLAADLEPGSAGLYFADGVVSLPRTDDAGFGDALLKTCMERGVQLVVPTRDGDLQILSGLKTRFRDRGVEILVPSPEALSRCADKRRFAAFCTRLGFKTPRTWSPEQTPDVFPVFVRPVNGAGGLGGRRLEAADWRPQGEGMLVQAFCPLPEYSIDVLMDLDGAPLQAVARRRLKVRAGEAVVSQVEDASGLTYASLTLCAGLELVGHNVVQAFWDGQGEPLFIEVNARFGGASNLSIQAGLASPERLVMMLAGDAVVARKPRPVRYGLTMLRYSQDLLVEAGHPGAV
ncbi:MAG: ATP-grasp domain-containing protein [Phenylobacterium sp.]|uniref:ATP-grasp domain-containing protein n=1 Tax=Phenylobacterium sp. TaxID=1871053 RepID=UPI0025ED597B|nr:ATP-grasp domain-containing protein [Phenylobacterium sp.]MCA3742242.1 ATP-grasp domain-containing protein [Phenylobacterium sp.]MCA3753109.1 ATP-grasp domain-containing protein [Phenylobacterium sp.]MCE2986638.1 ATP-grasp domain-containing protein [Phenylobacterium sp.]